MKLEFFSEAKWNIAVASEYRILSGAGWNHFRIIKTLGMMRARTAIDCNRYC